jgi:hypothetical protein
MLSAAPFFALPGNAVAHDQVILKHALNYARRLPFAAQIDCRPWPEESKTKPHPITHPGFIISGWQTIEDSSVE